MTAQNSAAVGRWLASPAGALTLAEVLLLWTVVLYAVVPERTNAPGRSGSRNVAARLGSIRPTALSRAVVMLIGILMLIQPTTVMAIGFVIALAAWAGVVTRIRARLGRDSSIGGPTGRGAAYAAEFELLMTGMTLLAAALVIESEQLQIVTRIALPFTPLQLAIITGTTTLYLFAAYGGAHIVRGVLEKGKVLPHEPTRIAQPQPAPVTDTEHTPAASTLGEVAYNRGRIIGMVERMILITLVAAGSYDALAFITAAKGLIRSKELENREFAEYFLLGTLTSTALALPLGLLVRALIAHW